MDPMKDEENIAVPREPEFVGEVPVVNRIEGTPHEGEVIGTGKLERLGNGAILVHIDGNDLMGEMLRRGNRGGFSLGEYSLYEPKTDSEIGLDPEIADQQLKLYQTIFDKEVNE